MTLVASRLVAQCRVAAQISVPHETGMRHKRLVRQGVRGARYVGVASERGWVGYDVGGGLRQDIGGRRGGRGGGGRGVDGGTDGDYAVGGCRGDSRWGLEVIRSIQRRCLVLTWGAGNARSSTHETLALCPLRTQRFSVIIHPRISQKLLRKQIAPIYSTVQTCDKNFENNVLGCLYMCVTTC